MHDAEPVIYQIAEDGLADTIKPRLERMGPNFKNTFIIDESQKGLTLTDTRVEYILKTKRPALMITDPLQAYLGADVDMHRASAVRPILAQVGRLAEQYRCTIYLTVIMWVIVGSYFSYRSSMLRLLRGKRYLLLCIYAFLHFYSWSFLLSISFS